MFFVFGVDCCVTPLSPEFTPNPHHNPPRQGEVRCGVVWCAAPHHTDFVVLTIDVFNITVIRGTEVECEHT
eukprot:m.46615 g.46615  ORF g.46615 m.46615 type:complete len:71 (+) comp20293_c0_seq1:121-333(+)